MGTLSLLTRYEDQVSLAPVSKLTSIAKSAQVRRSCVVPRPRTVTLPKAYHALLAGYSFNLVKYVSSQRCNRLIQSKLHPHGTIHGCLFQGHPTLVSACDRLVLVGCNLG